MSYFDLKLFFLCDYIFEKVKEHESGMSVTLHRLDSVCGVSDSIVAESAVSESMPELVTPLPGRR
jgi:hypothetical protein